MLDSFVNFRLKWVWIVGILSTLAVAFFFPQQLGVLLYKVNTLALAIVGGYLADRALFPYARPDSTSPNEDWMYRRAIIVGAVTVAVALVV
jgi:uncharacterized protein (UPF0303 family)